MKSDLQLRDDVEAELAWNTSFDDRDIGVAAKHGVVTLTGRVNSYMARLMALKAAQSVAGVQAIADEIEVTLPGDAQRTDTQIAEAAIHALGLNAMIPAAKISIVAKDGWLTLTGEVDLWLEKREAERAVRSLWGVRGLSNNISIKPNAEADDVKKRIEKAFERRAHLDAKGIRVSAVKGAVTLEGHVPTWPERWDAESAAWATPGVTKVHDRLTIGF